MSEAILRGKIKPALSTNAFLLESVCPKKKQGAVLGKLAPVNCTVILYFILTLCDAKVRRTKKLANR